ncbi:fructose 1,6-bisphosphatase [Secundilactobacillus paracollinoides]|uniref:inositol monophosphatase family protein n=1 Tax=Secundilactobacillus paracollinoides TaxID=240427 RepID=UPI0006F0F19C|nr:inositol monophosphatase family protein [Secundilactobacillus paracollinoides]ANZ63441.1 fructose 1,6-bisphosphatase [Secundilactobacillus paracollinoides]KRL75797.1 inositol monophosphatase family protein [Secundilactobacillus paracollinoides DSM 15502 = JCM 11969]
MSEPTLEQVDQTVKTWLRESRDLVLKRMATPLNVDQKTGRKDLVTNVDKENERLLVSKIRAFSPDSQVLGEEGFGDQVTDTAGWVWVVDPIDGTMNFVKQRDHFAMMIALYIDGQGVLGYIYDVINDALYSGGPSLGVFKNDQPVAKPANVALRDGLVAISGPLVTEDVMNMPEVIRQSAGFRAYGSAGIEFSLMLTGELITYVSYLKPWDFGAGKILAETLGLRVTRVDGTPLSMLSSDFVMVATEKAQQDILPIIG